MTIHKPIFGLRFGSNEELSPTREELEAFLAGPREGGGREPYGNALVTYRVLLEAIKAFEQQHPQDMTPQGFQEKMFYGVLGHSQFFNPVLASAVEQYNYHLHALKTIDFKKPLVFIKAAEDEMSRLNPKKRDDAVKLARFRDMIDERKKMLTLLERRRAALVRELGDIALYLRDNLFMIEKRCETSIVVLVELQISRKKENQLIEDIKTHFREHLRDFLDNGPVARQYVEIVKKDVAQLSKEISFIVREDVYALTRLYEAVHDHTKKAACDIDRLMAKTERGKNKSIEDDRRLFEDVEKVLISLISEYHFELKPTIIRSETAHQEILLEKRNELLDDIFELLKKERRARLDRRSAEERRKFTASNITGPERRKGKERRSGKKRR
jgi:hypothetical protein